MKIVGYIILGILIVLAAIGVWLASVYSFSLKACNMRGDSLEGFQGPIDLVYTWVDGCDEKWRQSQEVWRKRDGHPPISARRNPTPHLAKDELFFSVLSVLKYMPWIRHIYILTQTPQRPSWLLKDTARIKVVHHEDVFGKGAALPSFNGILNSSQVHRIPDLAEHFIYMDDDIFIGKPLKPGYFFDRQGHPVYKFSMELLSWFQPSAYAAILRNTHRLCVKVTKSPWLFRLHHMPNPLTRSACFEVERRLGQSTLEGMLRFRSKTTYEFPFIVANYLLGEGSSRRSPKNFKVGFYEKPGMKKLQGLKTETSRPHVFCINSGFGKEVSDFFAKEIFPLTALVKSQTD